MKTHRDGLTPGERAILDAIRDNPDKLGARELAERFDSTPGSIKVFIAKLRRKGYCVTSPRYRDAKSKRLGVRQTYRIGK